MKKIYLNNGTCALVDDEDYWLNIFKWSRHPFGYPKTGVVYKGKNHSVCMHQVIMEVERGESVDHINGDPLDNRRSNLRIATQMQNMRNRGMNSNNTTGYKGVSKFGKRFRAMICVNYKPKSLGLFDTAIDAAAAYNTAALDADPEFARINSLH